MPNDPDRGSLGDNPVGQKPRSYTYGYDREYRVDQGSGWLPRGFWRETVAFKGFSYTFVPAPEEDYSDYNIKKQNVLIARAVARYNRWLAVIAFIAAIVSGFQWYEIHSGSADTHDLAEAAKTQAENSRKALVASERAWIGPVDASITKLAVGEPIAANIQYRNSGKEPSPVLVTAQIRPYLESEFGRFLGSTEDILAEKQRCIENTFFGGAYAFPNSGFSQNTAYVGSQNPENIIKFKADAGVLSGAKVVIITGCFTYSTQKEIKHTAFCYFYKAKVTADLSHMNICDTGWYAD